MSARGRVHIPPWLERTGSGNRLSLKDDGWWFHTYRHGFVTGGGCTHAVPGSGGNMRHFVAVTVSLLLGLALAVTVYGKASHDGWPTNKCSYRGAPDSSEPGTARNRGAVSTEVTTRIRTACSRYQGIDELLGGHGNDLIYGARCRCDLGGLLAVRPAVWPARSSVGGPGNDFMYVSHGTNRFSPARQRHDPCAFRRTAEPSIAAPATTAAHQPQEQAPLPLDQDCELIDNKPE